MNNVSNIYNNTKLSLPAREVLLSLAGFIVLSVVMTWPQVIVASQSGYSPDFMLNEWVLKWDIHALRNFPLKLFDAGIFYPSHYTLALSDHMLGILPLWLLFYLPSGDAHAAYNWTGILIYALTGWGVYLLARYWTGSIWGALAAGIVAGFHPIKMYHYNILPLVSLQWFPLILLSLELFRKSGRIRWVTLAGALYCLQLMSGLYNAYATSLAITLYLIVSWIRRREWLRPGRMILPVTALAIAMLINIPLLLPYYFQQKASAMSNPAEGRQMFLPKLPADIFKTAPSNKLYGSLMKMGDSTVPQPLFPGIVCSLMFGAGILHLARRSAKNISGDSEKNQHYSDAFRLFGLPGLLLAAISIGAHPVIFGTRINFPLPYTVLAWIMPGFHNIRVPQRFAYTALVFGGMFTGYGVTWLAGSSAKFWNRSAIGAACVAGLLAESWMAPFYLNQKPEFKKVIPIYQWLHDTEISGAVLEIPVDSKDHFLGAFYDLMSLTHGKQIVNGYSGYAPPTYRQFVNAAKKLPDEDALQVFDLAGVHTIIEHRDFSSWLSAPYPEPPFQEPFITKSRPLEQAQGKGLKLVAAIGADVVWRIELSPVKTVSTGSLTIRRIFSGPEGEGVIVLDVVGDGGAIWKNSDIHKTIPARLVWTLIGRGVVKEEEVSIPLPIAAPGGDLGETVIFGSFPKEAGVYELAVKFKDDRVRGTVQTVTIKGPNE